MAYGKTNWTSTTPINPTNLNKIENGIEQNSNDINNIVNVIYPIGSIYMSINSTSPETLFGGTWEQIKDTFLLSAGDTYEAGATGGEAEHTLTIEEMPNHSHYIGGYSNNFGSEYYYNLVSGGNNFGSNRTGGEGGGEAHNNMPPYLTVYMWKRIA